MEKENMKDKKISVIIPVMNAESYLRECLESVLNQTYSNLEILLIYTESSDATIDICKEYASVDKRVIFFKNETGLTGPGISRNIGLQNMTGDLLGFVDADDCIAKDLYRILFESMYRYDADISICKETRHKKDITKEISGAHIVELNTQEALAEFLVGSKFHGELWNKLYKIECIQGAEFIETGIGEDIMFVWTVMQNAHKIVYSDAERYFYRFNPESITKQYKVEDIDRKKELYATIGYDVELKYPKIQRQLNNRLSIVNAQNYIAFKSSKIKAEDYEKELIRLRKAYKFRNDGYSYSKKEELLARWFGISPLLLFEAYKFYTKMRGRGMILL